jgi:uroporphyrinogen-III synthase
MRLIITRPADDAALLAAKLHQLGHATIAMPLLRIVPRPGVEIPSKKYQLICATSANAIKHAVVPASFKNVSVITVGPQSLSAARAAGFNASEAHGGDVDGLVAHITKNLDPANGPILYLSGAETSADLKALLQAMDFQVDKMVIYDAVRQAPGDMAQGLALADGVLLYSPRSARIWCEHVASSDLETAAARPIYLCLSENVARVLPPHWQKRVAKTPDEPAMLALLD